MGCTTSLEGLLSEGLVSSEELSAFMLPLLKQGANTENLHMFNYYRDFLTEEVRHELASQAYKLFFEGTSEHLGELDEYAEILTKEQIRAVLYHQLPNLSNLNSYTDLIREYLSVDELSQLFIEGDKIKDRFIGEDIDTLLRLLYREGAVTIDFIEDHIRTTSFHSPKIALLSLLRLPVGLEFKKTTMQELLPEVGVEVQFDLRNTWIPLLYEDVAVQKKVLQDLILRTNNVSFIRTYAARAASNSDSDEVINLLSDSDLKDLFMQNLDLDEGGLDTAVVGTIESLRLLFTREELSTIVMPRLLHNSPLFVVKYYHEMRFSLSPGELAILRQAADSGEIFESVEYLSDILGQEEIQQVVLKHIGRGVKLPTSYDLDRLSKGLGAEFMPKLIQELILVNPVHCVSLYGKSKHFFAPNGVTYDDLIEIARGARYSSLIPNVVEKGFVGIDSPDSLQKLSKLYSRIYAIELVGIASVLAAENESSTSVKSDVNGVNAVQAVAKIATLHPNIFTKYQDLLTSEKYKAGLAQALPDIFEIDPSELPEESIAVQDYESVLALIEYNAKHGKKPEYTSLLRAVALASLSGSSVDIKFGLPDGFEELKDSMLLPANMNREAYTLWQEGADVESEELVADTANELARSIRRTLESEIGHVNDYFVTNFGLEFDGYAESLSDISSHLQELGQAISLASSEYKTAKQLGSDEAALLNDKRLKLVFLRDALKTKELILRVYNLTDSEISQGYVLTEGKKSDSIDNVLKDITGRMSSQPDAARALENLRSQFYKFKTQVYIKQQLHTYITGKPEDIILVGARPVESCQHYLDGGYNEALLAYMVDPNTQVIYVEDTQHTPIARSIIRLLSDSSGNPALHVERVYSSFASVAVRKQVYEAAYRVSEAMGVPLYISTATQRAETGSEVEEIVGFDFSPSSATLQSNNSRGPFVYVDSAGGITTRGRYLLKDLQLVSRL